MHSQHRGKATFYSKRATGARTSSGERLHHDSLTCAHRTYPFGTRLKVTNLSNGKSVVVRVTDRGPYGKGKIIDLSHRAASEIGMIAQGVAFVEIEVVKDNIVPLRPDDIKFEPREFDILDDDVDFRNPVWKPTQKEETSKPGKKHTTASTKSAAAKTPVTTKSSVTASADKTEHEGFLDRASDVTHSVTDKVTNGVINLKNTIVNTFSGSHDDNESNKKQGK